MRNLICLLVVLLAVNIGASAQHQKENTYQVATFNIRMDTPKDSLNAWVYRKDLVNALITYHELDIIGTQEGFKHQLDDIGRLDHLQYVGKGRDDGMEAGEHSAIFYNVHKFDVLDKGDFWLSETPDVPGKGWDAVCCNRIASWVKLKDKHNGKQFFVFNAHFDHQGVKAKEESAKLLLKKVAEIAKQDPVMVMGDFNSTPESKPIKTIGASLLDAYRISKLAPYGPVGTTNQFNWQAAMKDRIDYVFVNKKIHVQKYASLIDALNKRFPSDHLPVVVEVSVD